MWNFDQLTGFFSTAVIFAPLVVKLDDSIKLKKLKNVRIVHKKWKSAKLGITNRSQKYVFSSSLSKKLPMHSSKDFCAKCKDKTWIYFFFRIFYEPMVRCTLSVMAMLSPNKVSFAMEAPPQVLHLTVKNNYILLNQDGSCWISRKLFITAIIFYVYV